MKTKRHNTAALVLSALALLALGACRPDDTLTPNTGSEALPVGIGQLAIASPANARAATRLAGTADDAFESGDLIRVSAPNATPGPDGNPAKLTATYIYKVESSGATQWTQVQPKSDGTDAEKAAYADGDTFPLYLESLATGDIRIETWGGRTSWDGTADYQNQSDYTYDANGTATPRTDGTPDDGTGTPGTPIGKPSGYFYRLNDYLLCPQANAAISGSGAQRRYLLSGSLLHQRVSLVVKIADGEGGDASGNTLPPSAVLRLSLPADGTHTTPRTLIAWREGTTQETNGKNVTTYRALVVLKDVPGITSTTTGGDGEMSEGTVVPGSVLGTMTYTPAGTSTPKTLRITYSVKASEGADANGNAIIAAGKRITVNATFRDISALEATATLGPWEDREMGDAGTGTDVADMQETTAPDGNVVYEIYSAKGLKLFADMVNGAGDYTGKQNLSANARLMFNIDLSSVCSEAKGTNWTPIAPNLSNAYTGSFDGQGHIISGLYYKGNTVYAGLFRFIGNSGKVANLTVKAEKIETTGPHAGVLAGLNYGTITNCRATGNVSSSGNDMYGKSSVGGLVGENNSGTIINCRATGNVSGNANPSNYVGGLVGENYSGTITNCYATGDASASNANSNYVGGLVGYNYSGTIIACYATGNATDNNSNYSYIGGLVGENSATITACYATGKASASGKYGNYVGGLVGENYYNSTITACYATGGAIASDGKSNYAGGLVGQNYSATITTCFWQKAANSSLTAGVGNDNSSSTTTVNEITGNGQNTWDTVCGTYGSGSGTLNAAIHLWNSNKQPSDAKYCPYKFVVNSAYTWPGTEPGVPPLLLEPINK